MEDLAEKWNSLSPSEREKTGFVLQKDQQTREFMLVAQFLIPRFLNMEIMAWTFKQLWRSTNGFKIRNQNDHHVLFVFDNLGGVDRSLKNQPWSFDKHLVMLQRYNSDTPVRDLVFKKTLFWVQVHDILVRFMMRVVAEEICDTIREVQKLTGGSRRGRWTFYKGPSSCWHISPIMLRQTYYIRGGKENMGQFQVRAFA